jgi:hypothetical protein
MPDDSAILQFPAAHRNPPMTRCAILRDSEISNHFSVKLSRSVKKNSLLTFAALGLVFLHVPYKLTKHLFASHS